VSITRPTPPARDGGTPARIFRAGFLQMWIGQATSRFAASTLRIWGA
jgi:hypothetical protein